MAACTKVRDRVRKFFNPDGFDPQGFRDTVMLGVFALCLGELVVYILLRQSAELGELPYYITDALIIGISSLEFLLCWFLGWLGSLRRRTMLVSGFVVVMACTVPAFALPGPEVIQDTGLCSVTMPRSFSVGVSTRAAVRLSLLLIFGVVCALARLIVVSHGLAYLDEYNRADNTHMHVGIFLLHRVLIFFAGHAIFKPFTVQLPWTQFLAISVKCIITLIRLFRYPVVAPTVEKEFGSDRRVFRSLSRVLSSGVAMLCIVAMALLAASLWGFSMHDVDFAKVKFHMKEYVDDSPATLRILIIILGVVLAGYRFTGPVMPKYDRKAAIRSAVLMSLISALFYIIMTVWGNCKLGQIAGLGNQTYSQPACGQTCGCDRPWMEFTPVCLHEQVTTYFSPCHAGCATADTVNNVAVYSNCTCAPGGRVTVGACDDGSCAEAYELHQLRFVVVALTSTLAMACLGSVLIQSVDRRDVSVGVALASGMVSLFAFVGAHGFYLGISSFTCAFSRGSKCLFHKESLVPWVGYSSATLAGVSTIFSIIAYIVLKYQRQPKEEEVEEDLTLS